MPRKTIEDRLEQLRQLKAAPPSADTAGILRKALADRSNLVVAEAAKTTGQLRLLDLVPDLLAAFDRLFEEAVKTDPKCWGKTAIVQALTQLDHSDSSPFLRGSRHVQMEPVWGGQEDSAMHLRANCFLALVQCTDLTRFELLSHLVDAMNDPADPVRIEAIRALNQLGGDEPVLLLRLKAKVGDRRPLIIGHCFDALLNLERDRAVPFVSEYLKSAGEELRDEAALALGAARLSSALNVLIDSWKDVRSERFSDVILRAVSSARMPEAIEFLLVVLRAGTSRQSAAAAEALKLHQDSPEIQALIEHAKRNLEKGSS